MEHNVGRLERIARLIIGVMILGLYGALPEPWRYITLLGLLPLGSAITGFCPIYAQMGWNRNKTAVDRENI